MVLNQDIFRGFSIRGVVGKDLDAKTMTLIGQGIGTVRQRREDYISCWA